MSVNSRQVDVLRSDTGGNYTTLKDYLERRKILPMPFDEVQEIAVSAANFVKVDSTTHLAGDVLTVLDATPPVTAITNGGIAAAELVGAVGTGATTSHADSLGNILNLVRIRDASTHEEIKTSADRTVFGLVQCALNTVEGAAVGAAASENTQISFVYIAGDGTVTLTAITDTIEFCVNKLYMEAHVPTIYLEGGNADLAVVEPKVQEPLCGIFTVTTAFAANEVLTLSTGGGAASGASTNSGDTVTIDTSAALFNANNLNRVRLNGVQLIRNVEAIWDSADSLHITTAMDVGDVLEVEVPIKFS
jgi:hypothetical protein